VFLSSSLFFLCLSFVLGSMYVRVRAWTYTLIMCACSVLEGSPFLFLHPIKYLLWIHSKIQQLFLFDSCSVHHIVDKGKIIPC